MNTTVTTPGGTTIPIGPNAPEPAWETCEGCGARLTWLRNGKCLDCFGKADDTGRRAERAKNLDAILRSAGLEARELRCSATDITPAIAAVLPGPSEHGFGLSGLPGIGKTGALAAFVRNRALESDGKIVWLSWPETVNWMRARSMGDGGHAAVSDLVEDAGTADTLVLDDLGAERLRGSYVEDWAASQLDRIVDARYRKVRPTWYTTSLDGPDIVARYGPRLYSRLCGENPLIELPKLPDRRVGPQP